MSVIGLVPPVSPTSMSDTQPLLALCASLRSLLPLDQEWTFDTLLAVEMTRSACVRLDSLLSSVSSRADTQVNIRSDWIFTSVQIAQNLLRLLRTDASSSSREELNSYTSLLVIHTSRLADGDVTNVSRWILNLPVALEFWQQAFGPSSYLCTSMDFKHALSKASIEPAWVEASMRSLDPYDTGLVSACKWATFYRAFYSNSLSHVLAKNYATWQQPWMAGYISKGEAEALLRIRSPAQGQFLVRFSMSRASTFALAVRRGDQIEHKLILVSESGKVRVDGEHETFDSVVAAMANRVGMVPCAQVTSVWRQPFFKGVLSKDETEERLKDQARGAYLFRFASDLSGAIVVALVTQNRTVRQIKFQFNENLNKFELDAKVVYDDLTSLIAGEADRLKQPVQGASPASIQGVAQLCKNGVLGMNLYESKPRQSVYDAIPVWPPPAVVVKR